MIVQPVVEPINRFAALGGARPGHLAQTLRHRAHPHPRGEAQEEMCLLHFNVERKVPQYYKYFHSYCVQYCDQTIIQIVC